MKVVGRLNDGKNRSFYNGMLYQGIQFQQIKPFKMDKLLEKKNYILSAYKETVKPKRKLNFKERSI